MCTHHSRRRMLISKILPKKTSELFSSLRIFLVSSSRAALGEFQGQCQRACPCPNGNSWSLFVSEIKTRQSQIKSNQFSMAAVKLKPAASSASSSQLRKSVESEVCCSCWHCCHLNKTMHRWTFIAPVSGTSLHRRREMQKLICKWESLLCTHVYSCMRRWPFVCLLLTDG